MFRFVGFCGSRSLPARFAGLVGGVARSVAAGGASVSVGCAAGADSFVRSAVPGCQVFAVKSGKWGRCRSAYAQRSVALVSSLGTGPGSAFIGFVSSPCPSRVRPSAKSSACFCGAGSGSWASLAFAVGSGVGAVVVFWCGAGAPQLPAWSAGSWVPAPMPFEGGWLFLPAAQYSLF